MFTVTRMIAAAPTAVWRVLVDLEAWPKWGPTVSGARLDAPHTELGLDVTGSVQTSLGFTVPFVVTEFEAGRHWAWKVAGVPATHHRVEPAGDHTRAAISVPLWAAPYLTVCAIGLRRIDSLVTGSS